MLKQRKQGIVALSGLIQALMVIFVFCTLQALVTFILISNMVSWSTIIGLGFITLFSTNIPFYGRSFKNVSILQLDWSKNHSLTMHQTGMALLMTCLYSVLLKNAEIQRIVLVEYTTSFYCVLLISNKTIPGIIARWAFHAHRSDQTVFIGSSSSFEKHQSWINKNRELGLDLIQCRDIDLNQDNLGRRKLLGELQQDEAKQLILLEMPLDCGYLRELVLICNRFGIRLLIINNLHEQIGHSLSMISYDGLQLIGLRAEPLESPFNRSIKRIFDLLIAIPVIILILPLLSLFIWAIQARQSPGPLFFRQQRAGFGNKEFCMLKFRTMRVSARQDIRQASVDDARVYPVGRWLRKLSWDEIPQFLNVFMGEMSVVGPRPHLIEHNKQFQKISLNYNVRTFVKPGITGLAQVRGFRGPLHFFNDLEERIKSDVYYIENWSLALDLSILIRTLFQILMPSKGAV